MDCKNFCSAWENRKFLWLSHVLENYLTLQHPKALQSIRRYDRYQKRYSAVLIASSSILLTFSLVAS